MDHLRSLLDLDRIAPEDQQMARMLLDEILRDNDSKGSEASYHMPECEAAPPSSVYTTNAAPSVATPRAENVNQSAENTIYQTVQSLPETASAPTDLYSTNPHPDGWQWADEKQDGTVLNKWCTMDPDGEVKNVITALIHLDRATDRNSGISIMLAFPAPSEEATNYWAKALNRSQVAEHIGKIVNTLNLPACRHQSIQWMHRARDSEGIAKEEEWLTRTANSLVAKFKFNEISGAGQSFRYKTVFRQAREWDDVINGHRYAKRSRYSMQTTLLHTSPRRHYELDAKQADRVFEKIKSLESSGRKKPGE